MKQIKTKIKIAVIAMMGMSLGVNAQDYVPDTGGTFKGKIINNSSSFRNHIQLKRLENNFNNTWDITLTGGNSANALTFTPEGANGYSFDSRLHISASKSIFGQENNQWDLGKINNRFKKLYTNEIDASGDIIANGFVSVGGSYRLRLNSNLLQFSRNGFSYIDNKDSNGSIAIRTGGTEDVDLLVRSDGNVGIGTTSPKAKLDVNGVIQVGNRDATNGGIIIAQKYTGNDYLGTLSSNYSSGALIMGYGAAGMPNQGASGQLISTFDNFNGFRSAIRVASGTFEFVSSPTKLQTTVGSQIDVESRFFINNQGKVGIGTKTMGNLRLAVEGSIGAREVKVEASGWSDFVFYDDYKLPTLKEVENHITEKGHLKDIPSAEEVEKNGFFLGEMDAKLLQKIEELTLYTIEQEKKIEALEMEKVENKKQQKEIEELKKQNSKIDRQQKEIKELKALVQKLLKDKN